MEEQKPIANLFDKIPIYDNNNLEIILKTLNKETATMILVNAVEYSFKKGIFSFAETELISKSLRTLEKKD
jgi:hypothetical protein